MPRTPSRPAETLPGEGRKGDPPPWPLAAQSPAEAELWAALWVTPQAVMWERLGSGVVRVVAHYARVVALAEVADPPRATLLAEIRAMEDRLGMTPKALAALRWAVDPPRGPAAVTQIADAAAARPRRRLSAVDPAHAPKETS